MSTKDASSLLSSKAQALKEMTYHAQLKKKKKFKLPMHSLEASRACGNIKEEPPVKKMYG